MSTIEMLFVQIFDRKWQIIEKLNHQKQLYDQHLLSKLLIQGIPPPSWLLKFNNQSSTSDLTELNKDELISGLLLPRPGPFPSYTSAPSFVYDQPVVAEENSGIPVETCGDNCASSNGFDEDSVAPLHHVDGYEDMDNIVPACHIDGAEDMADTIPPCHVDGTKDIDDIVPPSHVDGAEDLADTILPCHVDGTEDMDPIVPPSHVDGTEDMADTIPPCHVDGTEGIDDIVPPSHVDGIEDMAGTIPPCHVDDTEDMDDIVAASHVDGAEDMADTIPPCHVDGTEDIDDIVPPSHVDGTEDMADTIPPCHVYGAEDRAGIVPPCHVDNTEDMADTIPPCHVDGSEDRAGIVPPCHADNTEDTAVIVSPSHVNDDMDTFSYVPMSPEDQISTRFSSVCKPEQSLARIQRSRSRQKALVLRSSAKASTKSRLGMENDVGSFHDGKICRYDEQFDLKRSLELEEPSAGPTEIRSNEEVAIENCSNKEGSVDVCGGVLVQTTGFDPLFCSKEEAVMENSTHKEKSDDALDSPVTHSVVSEAMEVELEDNQKIEEFSSCQQLMLTNVVDTVDAQSSRDKFVHEEAPVLDYKVDRNSYSEIISKSATFGTPVSPFPTGCKMYLAPSNYSSVPNGLLENIDLPSNLLPSGSAFLGKSHSDLFSFPGRQYGWEIKKPFLSPVGKGFKSATPKSASSDKLGSSNLELTCFPIQEDPESVEEEVDDAVDIGVEKTSSNMKNSINIEPLFDITLHSTSSLAPDHSEESVCLESMSMDVKRTDSSTRSGGYKDSSCDIAMQSEIFLAPDDADKRRSQGSVCTEFGTFEKHNDSKKRSKDQKRSMQTRFGKENNGLSVGAYSSKKQSKPHSSRFGKPKLSGKSSFRSKGQSLSEKEQKPNNIISNIKSFVPLVQQKQAAAALPEKRNVKVKALQAAEAAKRAAEIKENERNQRKEAMKLERARVEQKNMKEMEVKRKLKEEQRKKREAENATKKRQREEEEKKEKERKKQRVEEARLQHKQAEDKLQAWKEDSRCAPEEGRAHHREDLNEKTEKFDKGHEAEDSEKAVNDLVAVGSDKREADDERSTLNDHKMSTGSAIGKVGAVEVAESSTPNVDQNDKPTHRTIVPQSYDISPYQCSDDEEDEMDRIPNKKFMPTWASSYAQKITTEIEGKVHVYMRTELAEDLLLACEQIFEGQCTPLPPFVS